MDNKVCSVLTVCFLFMAALHLEAVVKKELIFYPLRWLTWEDARLFCQENDVDLAPLQALNEMPSRSYYRPLQNISGLLPLWIGLVRHPEDASIWKEVNFTTGGLSEDNISLEIKWDQNTDPLCAFVLKIDQMWYSGQCSDRKMFYCSLSDGIQYFKTHSSWDEASMSCQKKSGQLVNMWNITAYNWKTSWIGAYERNDVWSWVGNSTHSFTNWAPNEPQSRNCALYNLSSQKYGKTFCSKKGVPLCLSDNLLVVKENKTWEEAQIYCLNMKACGRRTFCKETYNLLSLDETSDYNYIRDRIYRATTTEVWIGLRFLGGSWFWVDGHSLEQTWELPRCPFQRNHCGTLSKYGTSNWNTRDCSEKRNFICYKN